MKIIFFGSSDFSIPFLNAIKLSKHEVVLTVTGSERQRGRGRKKSPNPVKIAAERSGINTLEVENLDENTVNTILQQDFEYIVLISFGKILPVNLIKKLKNRTINLHPSLLPRYRGPSPITTALLNGDKITGISLITICEKVDEGDIYMQNEIEISKDDNRDILEQKIIDAGIPMLLGLLDRLEKDEDLIYPQSSEGVSYTRTFNREDLKIKWDHSVTEIHNRVRAFSRYPGCFSYWRGKYIKILKTRIPENPDQQKDLQIKAGKVIMADKKGLFVICGDKKTISIIDLKPPGKNIMSYIDFINGYKIKPGDIFE